MAKDKVTTGPDLCDPSSVRAMTEQEVGWLAGIIEGEGYITLQPDALSIAIGVEMTDEDVVRRLHAVTGVGSVLGPRIRGKGKKPHWKPQWKWKCGRRNDVLDLFDAIEPLMGRRRRERIQKARGYVGNERILPAKCGTTAGYHRHKWLNEKPCRLCYDALYESRRAKT